MERKQSKDAAEFREQAAEARAAGQSDLAQQLEEWADQIEMGGNKPAKDLIGKPKPPAR